MSDTKFFNVVWAVGLVLGIALWGAVIYVAAHFISKVW